MTDEINQAPGLGGEGGGGGKRRWRRRRGRRGGGQNPQAQVDGEQQDTGSGDDGPETVEEVTGTQVPPSAQEQQRSSSSRSRRRRRGKSGGGGQSDAAASEQNAAAHPEPPRAQPGQQLGQRQQSQPNQQRQRGQQDQNRQNGERQGSPPQGPRQKPERRERIELPKNSRPNLANESIWEVAGEKKPEEKPWTGLWRNMIAYVPDMFFGAKIADAGKKVGYRVYFLREVERLQEKIRELKPDLIIIDTATDRNVWTSLVRAARDVDAGMYPVITFGSHRDLDSRSAALETGASDFIANSRFFPEMVRVFEKYARVPTEYELEEAAREAEARGEPVPDTKGLWRGSNRFKRGPIIPGPAEDDAEDEAPSFLSLRKTGATNPFNPNPDPGGD